MQDLRTELSRCFNGRACLMGLGNRDYGDDGFGAVLSELILDRLKGTRSGAFRHLVINAEGIPERFIPSATGFDHLIFLDAVEFGGVPGAVVFLDAEQMDVRFPQISTHRISLGLLAKLIECNGNTRAWLLGVQPRSLKQGQGLTPEVETTTTMLIDMIMEMIYDNT